ncbi:hypothetical protein COL68_25500 [Bacillus wiedmannii]|uniref:hypothetical protein n=1 Tax=Bacillus wiedmannii TaxID=1890302 RepID=UPI000BF676CC|nr:hypothetical protein [Bacillus wiedmannii]PFZ52786.1 hypothetical protein COL68_25500 [Bacillus wiedmannii]
MLSVNKLALLHSRKTRKIEWFTILTRESLSKSIEEKLNDLAYSLDSWGKLSLFDLSALAKE